MANIRTLKDIKKNDPPRGSPGGGREGGPGPASYHQTPPVTDPKRVHVVHSEQEYATLVQNAQGLVVVDFSAAWCGPCKMIYPHYVEMSVQHPDVTFIKVDVDKLRGLANRANVTAMPTFHFIHQQAKIGELRGANPNLLQQKIQEMKQSVGAAPAAQATASSDHSWGSGHSLSSDASAGQGIPVADAAGGNAAGGAGALSIFVDNLVGMGFDRQHAEKAVKATKSTTLDAAIDWIVSHPMEAGDAMDTSDDAPVGSIEAAGNATEVPEAKPEASASPAPAVELTEEEKKEKAEQMKQRLEAIRIQKAKEAEARDFELEKNRVKSAEAAMRTKRAIEEERHKVELAKAKKKKEMEKKHAADVKARVRAAREARLRANAKARGETLADSKAPATPAGAKAASGTKAPAKVYTECAIAVRTPQGTLKETFPATETLQAVFDWVASQLGRSDFALQTNYPRKTYAGAELATTLKAADLVPRGALSLK